MSCKSDGGKHSWSKRFVQLVLNVGWAEEWEVSPVSTVTYSYCPRCGKVLL
jgi:predicted RNA-binding Zn-ribbon protein involved in translation (DUF1610 family)